MVKQNNETESSRYLDISIEPAYGGYSIRIYRTDLFGLLFSDWRITLWGAKRSANKFVRDYKKSLQKDNKTSLHWQEKL